MKILVKICLVLILLTGLHSICFAEVKTAQNGLFSIDNPEGWNWDESQEGTILISRPDKTVQIRIKIAGLPPTYSPDRAKEILKDLDDGSIEKVKSMGPAEILDDKETTVGGVFARELFYTDNQNTAVNTSTNLFYNNNTINIMTIRYKTDDEGRQQIDQILQSLKFIS